MNGPVLGGERQEERLLFTRVVLGPGFLVTEGWDALQLSVTKSFSTNEKKKTAYIVNERAKHHKTSCCPQEADNIETH